MATQEYLVRYIEAGKRYDELPARLKLAISEEEWSRKVKTHCIARGSPWTGSPAALVCTEHEYYEELLAFYRTRKRLFPYHLGEYVCRVLRVTPFHYYRDILADAMREDSPYDSVPNFTAADVVQVVGISRNEYIATMQQAKSKRLLWRVNKGLVRDLLPQEPRPVEVDPWWRVHLVNLGEVEYRQLSPAEAAACHVAARPGGAPCRDMDSATVGALYRRGLVWFEVPVGAEDHLSIPPLEGFVSNKSTTAGGADVDPLETLLYQVFVAASDRVTVSKLASILNVDVGTLRTATSVACRLRFCRKLHPGSQSAPAPAPHLDLDLDACLQGGAEAAAPPEPLGGREAAALGEAQGGVALVVDSEITGYLMMGALTPGCKKHSVTLFEGGRVYGADVIAELIAELRSSVELAAGFEGEMAALVNYARSLAVALECVKGCAGGRPIELLRKESVASMGPPAAYRVLSHSYSVVLPVASLPFPPLPLSPQRDGPANYGPFPAAATPWMQLAFYAAAGCCPPALVMPAGRRLLRLPPLLTACSAALVWPWSCRAVRAPQCAPAVLPAASLLAALNQYLGRTAIMVQPLSGSSLPAEQVGSGNDSKRAPVQAVFAPVTVDVPLPLNLESRRSSGTDWADFGEVDAPGSAGAQPVERSAAAATGAGDVPSCVAVNAFAEGGAAEEVQMPASCVSALRELGLGGAVGTLRLLCDAASGRWLPLQLTLGLPLQPPELCQAVCDGAAAAGFLSPAACAAHSEGQRTLHAALEALAARHGLRSGRLGSDDHLSAGVASPVHALEVDGAGRVGRADLSAVVQGLPGVLGELGSTPGHPL